MFIKNRFHPLPSGLAHGLALGLGEGEKPLHCLVQALCVLRLAEEAADAVFDGLPAAGNVAGDHRPAAGGRFQIRIGHALVPGGEDEAVAVGNIGPDVSLKTVIM